MKEVLLFNAGDGTFGVDLSRVSKILSSSVAAEEAPMPPRLADLLDMSGGEDRESPGQAATLVLDGGDLTFRVDRISGVATAHDGEIVSLPSVFGGSARRFFPEVLLGSSGPALLLHPEAAAGGADFADGGLPAHGAESDAVSSDMSAADLEAWMLRRIGSDEMTRRIEAVMRRLSEATAQEGMARIRAVLARRDADAGGDGDS